MNRLAALFALAALSAHAGPSNNTATWYTDGAPAETLYRALENVGGLYLSHTGTEAELYEFYGVYEVLCLRYNVDEANGDMSGQSWCSLTSSTTDPAAREALAIDGEKAARLFDALVANGATWDAGMSSQSIPASALYAQRDSRNGATVRFSAAVSTDQQHDGRR